MVARALAGMRRYAHTKVTTMEHALKHVRAGQTIMSGGFGISGIPDTFLTEIAKHPDTLNGLTIVSNNGGAPGIGVDRLVQGRQVSKMVMSYIGARVKEMMRQFMSGELEIELTPQGTLAERARAAGAGIGAFYTRTGVNTWVEEGRMPLRHDAAGAVVKHSPPKESRVLDGVKYILEHPLHADVALVHASKADTEGNLWFDGSVASFNAVFAKAARVTLVEADEIVEAGAIPPNSVHVPGIHVTCVVPATAPKHIEVLTVQEGAGADDAGADSPRVRIAKRAALELRDGTYCNLGVGVPTMIPSYLPPGVEVTLESENGLLGVGAPPRTAADANPDLINASKETCTLNRGASAFASDESFSLIRAGKLDTTVLGAIEVSQFGDLANWGMPGRIFGTGGAMDLVSNPDETHVMVTTTHVDKKGRPKIVAACSNPLTGTRCVRTIVTDLAVFKVDFEKGLTLVDLQPGVTVEQVRAATGAPFAVQLAGSRL